MNPDNHEHRQVIIIGAGTAGLTTAIYAARANLEPLIIQGPQPGGQLVTTTDVENYPGFESGILGPELMQIFEAQAVSFGTEIRRGTVNAVDLSEPPFHLTVDYDRTLLAESIIVATGASPKKLGLNQEQKLTGQGVSYCATCDGAFFQDGEVAVVGGGDTALEDALFLTRFASQVYLIHRRDRLRASKILQNRAFANEKITFIWNTEVAEILAQNEVKELVLNNKKTKEKSNAGTGCMAAIDAERWLQSQEQVEIATADKLGRTS